MKKHILIFIYVISNVYAWAQSENTTIPYHYSDTTWERLWGYSGDIAEERRMLAFLIEHPFTTYDRGFLFGIAHMGIDTYLARPYLVKTDNNGYQLWQKQITVNDNEFLNGILTKTPLPNGDVLLSLLYPNSDNGIWTPMICLLNPCGEVVWAKELRCVDRYALITDAKIDKEGDIVIVLEADSKPTPPYYDNRCWLIKMSYEDGEIIFHKSLYKKVINDFILRMDLHIDEDNNYYVFSPYFFGPANLMAQFITKLNAEAETLWEIDTRNLPVKKDRGFTTYYRIFRKIGPDKLRLLGINFPTTAPHYPYILDINTDGSILDMLPYNVFANHDTMSGYFISSYFMQPLNQDSSLFASMIDYTLAGSNTRHYGYVVFDSALRVQDYKIDIDELIGFGYMEGLSVDNGQFLSVSTRLFPNVDDYYYSNVRLAKYNADLSYANVIDDSSWTYDSLCPHAINNDPINIEPDIYLNMEEYNTKAIAAHWVDIQIQPNPTHSPIHISLQGVERAKNIQLSIVDIQGQTLWQQAVTTSGTINIDSKTWASGVYSCVAHDSQGRIVGKTKLVIK